MRSKVIHMKTYIASDHELTINAKPFVKWAGGKGQLIEQLEALFPADLAERKDLTYVEPFVGGGAMVFHMLEKYKNITRVVINDFNRDLVTTYVQIKECPDALISELQKMQVDIVILDMPLLNTAEKSDLEKSLIANIVFELLAVNIIAEFCELSGCSCLCLLVLFLHALDGFVVLIWEPASAELLKVVTE